MRLYFLTVCSLLVSGLSYGQVGMATSAPKATLDIAAIKTDGSTPEGLIAPRLTGDQIKAADTKYEAAQKGAIVYATAPVTTASTKTANITKKGYYYFDGSVWTNFVHSLGTTLFIPYVAVSGKESSPITQEDQQSAGGTDYTKWTFSSNINDNNWSDTNHFYTVSRTGYYQMTLRAEVTPSNGTTNSFTWVVRFDEGNANTANRYEFENFSHVSNSTYTGAGGTAVFYLTAGTVVDFGGTPCSGCAGHSSYTITDREFSITYLGL
ncbi:MAG: hypothetical protein ACK5MD_07580 [Flavobacteriales bacterium]